MNNLRIIIDYSLFALMVVALFSMLPHVAEIEGLIANLKGNK